MAENLLRSDRGKVRLLTLNRPRVLNAFDNPLFDAVADALDAATADDEVSCVVITGEGRAFSSGLDLTDTSQVSDDRGFIAFIERLEAFEKPLIAAVNGLGVGVGMTMLLHCDIVVMSQQARLKAPFVEIGLTGEAGSTYTFQAAFGPQRASHLFFAAPWVSADEAVDLGLALQVVEPERLMEATFEIAERVASMPVTSLVATKRLLVAGRVDAIRAARARENAAFVDLRATQAHKEILERFRKG